MSGAKRFERSYDSEPYRVRKRPSYLSPAAGRCHLGNSHSADTAPDYGPEQDTGRGDPRIYAADRARCTVAKPQRCARATARTLSPAARRRRVSPSPRRPIQRRAGRRVMPPIPAGALPAAPQPPVFGRPRQHGRRMPRQPRPPGATPGSPGSRAGLTIW